MVKDAYRRCNHIRARVCVSVCFEQLNPTDWIQWQQWVGSLVGSMEGWGGPISINGVSFFFLSFLIDIYIYIYIHFLYRGGKMGFLSSLIELGLTVCKWDGKSWNHEIMIGDMELELRAFCGCHRCRLYRKIRLRCRMATLVLTQRPFMAQFDVIMEPRGLLTLSQQSGSWEPIAGEPAAIFHRNRMFRMWTLLKTHRATLGGWKRSSCHRFSSWFQPSKLMVSRSPAPSAIVSLPSIRNGMGRSIFGQISLFRLWTLLKMTMRGRW